MNLIFRPLVTWPQKPTPASRRRSRYTFKAKWPATLGLLDTELSMLNARNIVIQARVKEDDIRLDGMLRASSNPSSPQIIISFDSKHGPLSYACDSCELWQHNVRSIALGLQALRAVDRYGISKRGEQYTGWIGIGTNQEDSGLVIPENQLDAQSILETEYDVPVKVIYSEFLRTKLINLLRIHHPDHGGDAAKFKQLNACKDLLS